MTAPTPQPDDTDTQGALDQQREPAQSVASKSVHVVSLLNEKRTAMAKKYGTYLIEYTDGTSSIHGNNYKPWYQHAVEYIYSRFKNPEHGWRFSDVANKIQAVKFSESPFIDDGGLKWATPSGYQEVIDEVGQKNHMQYTPLKEIKFANSSVDKSKLIKKLKEY